MDDDGAQSGYYREIARAFLGRRGWPLLLSPKDQAAIAAWEADRVPLPVVLEGIGRVRNVVMSPDGLLYVAIESPGKIVRLIPME